VYATLMVAGKFRGNLIEVEIRLWVRASLPRFVERHQAVQQVCAVEHADEASFGIDNSDDLVLTSQHGGHSFAQRRILSDHGGLDHEVGRSSRLGVLFGLKLLGLGVREGQAMDERAKRAWAQGWGHAVQHLGVGYFAEHMPFMIHDQTAIESRRRHRLQDLGQIGVGDLVEIVIGTRRESGIQPRNGSFTSNRLPLGWRGK